MKIPILFHSSFKVLHKEEKAVLLALTAVLFWSTVPTAFKIGLNTLLPEQLIFIASGVSFLILLFLVIQSGKSKLLKSLGFRSFLHSALLGFLNPFLYYILLFKAYSLLPAQVAQPINMVWPIVLVLLSAPLLNQPLTAKVLISLFISFTGVFLISGQGRFFQFEANPEGVILALISSLVWSLYWIFNVKSKNDELIKLLLNFAFGTLYLGVYLLLFSDFSFEWNKSMKAAIYIGFFEIGFSFVLWMKALSLTSDNARIANLIYIAPFLSLIFVHFILGEEIYLTTVIGITLIVAGILYQQYQHRKKRKAARSI